MKCDVPTLKDVESDVTLDNKTLDVTLDNNRGLDALLGHLLDKRISVQYKLTTIVAVKISLKI